MAYSSRDFEAVIEQNLLWASKEVSSIVGLMSDGTNLDEFKERIKVFRKNWLYMKVPLLS